MSKQIRVECEGATTVPYQKLLPLQGNLKSLSKQDYERLRDEIVADGFSEPISAWKTKKGLLVLNGHQRLRTVKNMVEKEGYKCPEIPISLVKAKDEKQARRKLLSMASQYGKVEKDGLYEFIHESDMQVEDVIANFRLPEIDLQKFADEYFEIPNEEVDLNLGGLHAPVEDGDANLADIRYVQLYFNHKGYDEFNVLAEELMKKLELDNLTEVVDHCVRQIHGQVCSKK